MKRRYYIITLIPLLSLLFFTSTSASLSTPESTGAHTLIPTPTSNQLSTVDCSNIEGLPEQECNALVKLYSLTRNGLPPGLPCTWNGVTCKNRHVTELSFKFGYSVHIPPESQLTLPPEIGNLISLEMLDLSYNYLRTLPPEIGNLTSLWHLNLKNNGLASLPPEIGNLSSLRQIYLSGNSLTELPPEIGNLSSLLRFELRDSSQRGTLSALPPEIGNLSSLEILEVVGQAFTTLPSEIGNLSSLIKLNVSYNQLEVLPPSIGSLLSLKTLLLDHNQLSTVPPEIGRLSNLESFFIQMNQLTTMPINIAYLRSLESLALNGNTLEHPIVRIDSNVTGLGVVGRDLPGPFYVGGTEVQLNARPLAGWRFSHWEGPENVARQAQITVTAIQSDDTYSAIFEFVGGPYEMYLPLTNQ